MHLWYLLNLAVLALMFDWLCGWTGLKAPETNYFVFTPMPLRNTVGLAVSVVFTRRLSSDNLLRLFVDHTLVF